LPRSLTQFSWLQLNCGTGFTGFGSLRVSALHRLAHAMADLRAWIGCVGPRLTLTSLAMSDRKPGSHCHVAVPREGGKPHGTRRLHRVAEKRCVLCTWVSTWPVLPVNVEDPASLRTLRPTSRTGAPRLGIGRNPLAAAIHSSLRVTTPTVNLTLRNIDVHSLRSRPRLRCIGCGHPAAQPRGESIMDRANPVPRAWLL
jgi:hypothetical protein